MELRRYIDPAAWGPDKRVYLAHPESEGYSIYPGPAGYRVVCHGAEVGVYPGIEAAKSAAFRHHRGEPDPGPIDPSLCGVPAGFVPPPFVPEEEAWMYLSDDDE